MPTQDGSYRTHSEPLGSAHHLRLQEGLHAPVLRRLPTVERVHHPRHLPSSRYGRMYRFLGNHPRILQTPMLFLVLTGFNRHPLQSDEGVYVALWDISM